MPPPELRQAQTPRRVGLLFDTVTFKRPAGFQAIGVGAERIAPQRQKNAFLILPDMNQFVDEQPLQTQIAVAEIVAE